MTRACVHGVKTRSECEGLSVMNLRLNRMGRSLKCPTRCKLSHAAMFALSLLRLECPRSVEWLAKGRPTDASHRNWSDAAKLFHRVLPMFNLGNASHPHLCDGTAYLQYAVMHTADFPLHLWTRCRPDRRNVYRVERLPPGVARQ